MPCLLSFRPCFLLIGDPNLFEEYRTLFLVLAKQLYQHHETRLAYLDTSLTKQVAFSKVFSSIYHSNEKKLFVSIVRNSGYTNLFYF